jgi:hypothetical protein
MSSNSPRVAGSTVSPPVRERRGPPAVLARAQALDRPRAQHEVDDELQPERLVRGVHHVDRAATSSRRPRGPARAGQSLSSAGSVSSDRQEPTGAATLDGRQLVGPERPA